MKVPFALWLLCEVIIEKLLTVCLLQALTDIGMALGGYFSSHQHQACAPVSTSDISLETARRAVENMER